MTAQTDETTRAATLDAVKPRTKPNRVKPSKAVDKTDTLRPGEWRDVPAADHGQRPYTLESANLEADLARQRDAALSELEAIDAAIEDINRRMARDIDAIRQRADAEITGRSQRADDLHRILAMTARALELPAMAAFQPKEPQTEAPTQEELAAQIEAQRQGEQS